MKKSVLHYVKITITVVAIAIAFGATLLYFNKADAQTANLIANGSLESESLAGFPEGWIKGKWGTNTATFTYPAVGAGGSRGAKVALTTRVSGDVKWASGYSPVIPGRTYAYADQYSATVPTILTAEFKMSNDALVYQDLGTVGASAPLIGASATFVPPPGAVSARVFHLINQVGELTIDNASLVDTTPPPSGGANLVANPSMETANGNAPTSWKSGKWGTNTATFTYPVPGFESAKGARVVMTARTSGDAKWYFDNVPVTPGTHYEFSNHSKSNVATAITVQFAHTNGATTYLDLGTVSASSDWRLFAKTFTVPAGVSSLTVFHVLNAVGTLDVDMYALREISGDTTLFDKGYVSLTFDDGYRSDYDVVRPRLAASGYKGTFFIVTERMATGNFPGFIKINEILALQSAGHEIGAHTRTHPDLAAIPPSQARDEIEGSRADLIAIGATPVAVFAYPFGSYTPSVKTLVRNAGFSAARSSDGGFNKRNDDTFALKRAVMKQSTTIESVRADIDTAIADDVWLILLFHSIDTTGSEFSVTPQFFDQVIDYIDSKQMIPLTISEGVAKMEP